MTLTHTITCLCFCLMTYPRHIWSQTFQIVLMDSTDHHRQGEEFGMFQSLDKYEYSIKSVRIGDNFQQIQYILYLLGENFEKGDLQMNKDTYQHQNGFFFDAISFWHFYEFQDGNLEYFKFQTISGLFLTSPSITWVVHVLVDVTHIHSYLCSSFRYPELLTLVCPPSEFIILVKISFLRLFLFWLQ